MKLKLTVAAVVFSAVAPFAHADSAAPQPSFQDWAPVDSQPTAAGTAIVHQFPQPSFQDNAPVAPAARAVTPQAAGTVAGHEFPQPSFQG
ncbi:MAG TPA: hypothetical protein VEB41_09275 [Burkholderiales bacterium]|nr:hypothetical protein [Burkholderiales bacterium]